MQIMEIDTAKGKRGSKRVSWTEKNPRELLFSIFKPGMSRQDLNAQVLAVVQNDFGYLPALVDYFTAYPYSALVGHSPRQNGPVKSDVSRIEDVKRQVLQLSLDFVVGDKAVRDYTGHDLAKAGGWLSTIGKKVGGKRVGDVFKSDAALRAALK